jgi:outer membrane cobalamin receptor
MHRPAAFGALLFLSLLTAGATAGAATGALHGVVRTRGGQPLPGLVVTLTGPEQRTLVTGPDGRYQAAGLRAGDYRLEVNEPGFVVEREARASVVAEAVALDLVLAPAPVREQVTVAATRGEAATSTLGASVTVLDREAIASRQSSSFLSLVQDVPGVATARTGGLGSQGSMFVRGGESRYARVLVDGVPVNEPGGFYNFGSTLPFDYEQVEVVRGAVSSLYGTDALAGVVSIVTRRAAPGTRPDLRLSGEGGSFGTWQASGVTSGRAGRSDWNAGLLRLETDNEVENNAFEQTAAAVSAGTRFGEDTTLRLALRAEDSTLGTPGPTLYGRPDLGSTFDRTDVVAGTQLRRVQGRLAHQLSLGWATTDQLSTDTIDSGCFTPTFGTLTGPFPLCDNLDAAGFQNDTSRLSAGYQLEAQAGTRHLVTAGLDVEHETGELGSVSGERIAPDRTNFGLYLQDRLVLGRRVFLTVGGRVEHNDSFGWKAVPRASLAWRLGDAQATAVKASAGAGIKEPDFFQSFGTSFFAQGNPDLKPERSVTFDLGVEQRLWSDRFRAEATYFHHEYKDQIAFTTIDFDTFQGTYVNLGKTRAQGLELVVQAAPMPLLGLTAAYTLTDGEVIVSAADYDPVYAAGEPLLRRPRHQASFSVRVGRERLSGALTVVAVGERADSDFLGMGLTRNEGYTRVDARVRGRVTGALEAFAMAENLFDAEYQEALGYPALGLSVRAGLRLRVGGAPR